MKTIQFLSLQCASVMKLCGIMDDDDFMDTDDIPSQVQNPPSAPTQAAYDIPSTLNSSTSNDIMVTIPYVPGSEITENQPYSFTIQSSAGTENASIATTTVTTSTTTTSTAVTTFDTSGCPKPITSKPNEIGTADRQYMIKIDNNDGTPPYPLSITLPHNMNPAENSDTSKMMAVATHSTISNPMNGFISSNHIQNNGMCRLFTHGH